MITLLLLTAIILGLLAYLSLAPLPPIHCTQLELARPVIKVAARAYLQSG